MKMSKRKLTNKRRNCVCRPENYKVEAFSPKLNEFRNQGILCDGVVHCADNKSIKIHRAILSTASPYFQSVFVNTLNRSEGDKNQTSVDISSNYFNLLLDYVYTGNCEITAGNVEELLIYADRADRWSSCNHSDQAPRAYHGVCTLGLLVYIIGGFDGSHHFNTMRCFDPMTKVSVDKACMYQARCYVSVAVQDGKIYALGGYNGLSRLSSVERYSPEQNQWEMVAPMNKHRSDASAASLEGKIYIIGGLNGLEILTSGEVFDPESNQWTFIMPMTSPRSGVSLVAYCGFLYAIGGYNGSVRLNTCEKIDPTQVTGWEAVANMGVTRSNFAAVILDGMIFAIGGFDGATTIPTVECYNGKKNRWKQVASMNLNRSALNACVIPGLPNAPEYSWFHRRAPWQGDQASSAI